MGRCHNNNLHTVPHTECAICTDSNQRQGITAVLSFVGLLPTSCHLNNGCASCTAVAANNGPSPTYDYKGVTAREAAMQLYNDDVLFLLLFLMMTMSSTILLPPVSLSLAPDWGSHSLLGGACKVK
jgi:hypothetical protein